MGVLDEVPNRGARAKVVPITKASKAGLPNLRGAGSASAEVLQEVRRVVATGSGAGQTNTCPRNATRFRPTTAAAAYSIAEKCTPSTRGSRSTSSDHVP